jgi:hypothetical protein
MNRRTARIVTRIYPRAWRERYAEEFTDFLEEENRGFRAILNVIRAAMWERIFPTVGGPMQDVYSFGRILKQPSAFIPLAMSLGALATVAVAAIVAAQHGGHLGGEKDEGSAAHIWQLLMTVQMPIVLWFAVKWLRRAPRVTFGVLALQAGAWLASCAPVYFLHL